MIWRKSVKKQKIMNEKPITGHGSQPGVIMEWLCNISFPFTAEDQLQLHQCTDVIGPLKGSVWGYTVDNDEKLSSCASASSRSVMAVEYDVWWRHSINNAVLWIINRPPMTFSVTQNCFFALTFNFDWRIEWNSGKLRKFYLLSPIIRKRLIIFEIKFEIILESVELWELIEHKTCQNKLWIRRSKIRKTAKSLNFAQNQLFVNFPIFVSQIYFKNTNVN